MANSQKNYINDIQFLRGICILMVVFEHLGHLLLWEHSLFAKINTVFGLWSAVDLFFVISGFVISRDLFYRLKDVNTTELYWQTVIAFWIRRAWRILPSAWLWLVVPFTASIFFNHSAIWGTIKGNLNDILAGLMQIKNFHNFSCEQANPLMCGSSGHYWSLSFEEQFYLIFPIFLLFFRKYLTPALFALIGIQLVFMPIGYNIISNYLRITPFLLGILLAIFQSSSTRALFEPVFLKPYKYRKILITTLILTCFILVGGGTLLISPPLRVNLVYLVAMLLVFLASYDKSYLVPEGAIKNVIVFLGMRSYSIYLIHVPVYLFTIELWYRLAPPESGQFSADYTYRFLITAFTLVAILSEANHRWVEIPLRRKGAKIAEHYISRSKLGEKNTSTPIDELEKKYSEASALLG